MFKHVAAGLIALHIASVLVACAPAQSDPALPSGPQPNVLQPNVSRLPMASPVQAGVVPTPGGDGLVRITTAEARKLVTSAPGKALLLDVRGSEMFDALHVKGALSLPETEVEQRLPELPRDKTLLLY